MKTLLATTTLLTLLSTGAQAITQKIEINLHAQRLRGYEQLPLKRMILREVQDRQALRGFKLDKVELQAKSKLGMASASLMVDRSESQRALIPGNEESFESDYGNFHTVTLNAPYSYRGDTDGPWRLITEGQIKLDSIKVKLKKQVRYDYENLFGLVLTEKERFKAGKLLGSTKTIHPRGIIQGIQLLGVKDKVSIREVEIKYMDGQVIELDELEGTLKEGRVKNFALKRLLLKPIRSISVTAATNSLFGSRGKVAVLIAK